MSDAPSAGSGSAGTPSAPASERALRRKTLLAELPTLLNSSLRIEDIVHVSLQHLRSLLDAGAATVFILESSSNELIFYAPHGGTGKELVGRRMPADAGLVGWVVKNRKPVLVNDVASDPRFFKNIDEETSFTTRNVLCVPLLARGKQILGALQVLNKHGGADFDDADLEFLEKFSHQTALAIYNAQLYKAAKLKSHQLAVLNRRKDEMISVISHEFRTPLNILQNSIELLTSVSLGEEERKNVAETLQRGVERLSSVIAKVRDVSKVTIQNLKVKSVEVSPAELFELMAKEFAPICSAQRRLEFATEVGPGVALVRGDPTLLLVVLKNLVSNAIRFTPDGGKVIVAAHSRDQTVEISVSDSGIGIEPSEHSLIFEKFYEIGDAKHHSSGTFEFRSAGLGLGLTTVKTILEAHGARIQLESSPGAGSRFYFELPAVATRKPTSAGR